MATSEDIKMAVDTGDDQPIQSMLGHVRRPNPMLGSERRISNCHKAFRAFGRWCEGRHSADTASDSGVLERLSACIGGAVVTGVNDERAGWPISSTVLWGRCRSCVSCESKGATLLEARAQRIRPYCHRVEPSLVGPESRSE
jgi:hypothetical protein